MTDKSPLLALDKRGYLFNLARLLDQTVYDLVHFLLTSCIVGFVKNGLFLCFGHGGISVEGIGVHSQRHAESQGNLVEIHHTSSLCCCVQHVLNKNAVACGGVVHKDMGHGAHQFAVLDNRTAGHADVK